MGDNKVVRSTAWIGCNVQSTFGVRVGRRTESSITKEALDYSSGKYTGGAIVPLKKATMTRSNDRIGIP